MAKSLRVMFTVPLVVAACRGGGGALTADDDGGTTTPMDAGADVAVAVDAGGDCPAVCPPASTENFCDNFNRTNPLLPAEGWHLAPNTTTGPSIEAAPCGHLLVDATTAVQMLERPIAETVSITVDFDLTLHIDPADAGVDDAGAASTVLLAIGASDGAIAEGSAVFLFFTATQAGVSIGSTVSVANYDAPADSHHFNLVVTGRGTNLTTTATLTITGGPTFTTSAAHFTTVPFKVLQLGLRNTDGLGHAVAEIDNFGVASQTH